MVSSSLSNKRYTYIHESESEGAIDIHHVIINGSRATGYSRLRWLAFFLVGLAFIIGKDNPARTLSWSCLLSGFFVMIQSRKFVKKESVIIMPTFGIQLETQYWKNCLQVYPYWQDFEACAGRIRHPRYMLLESLLVSAWRRTAYIGV
ncbi:Phosphatidylinositol N-acetylglucosaminyltransferase [Hirschfeldia incana]|nr:Phosphatidylinositol N-acetylglucosaminyltransferase [Hirschfeldia incana]